MLEFQVFEEVEYHVVGGGRKMTVSKANLIVVCMWGCAVWCGRMWEWEIVVWGMWCGECGVGIVEWEIVECGMRCRDVGCCVKCGEYYVDALCSEVESCLCLYNSLFILFLD